MAKTYRFDVFDIKNKKTIAFFNKKSKMETRR